MLSLRSILTRAPHRAGAPVAETKECPACGASILAAARICKRCRQRLDGWDELLERVSA